MKNNYILVNHFIILSDDEIDCLIDTIEAVYETGDTSMFRDELQSVYEKLEDTKLEWGTNEIPF